MYEQLERVESALAKIERGETQRATDSLKKVISEFKLETSIPSRQIRVNTVGRL